MLIYPAPQIFKGNCYKILTVDSDLQPKINTTDILDGRVLCCAGAVLCIIQDLATSPASPSIGPEGPKDDGEVEKKQFGGIGENDGSHLDMLSLKSL